MLLIEVLLQGERAGVFSTHSFQPWQEAAAGLHCRQMGHGAGGWRSAGM